jgi:hypothetical protein
MLFHQPFIIPALAVLITALPLAFGLISRNPYYGFRNAKTLSDAKVWYRVNRIGGWGMSLSSLCYLVVADLYPAVHGQHDVDFSKWIVHLAVFVVPLLLSVLIALKSAK